MMKTTDNLEILDNYINRVKTLPPAPKVVAKLLVLLGRDDIHADQVVELITFDPALTAKVLQCCNSAAAGLAQKVYDLRAAVACLGFNEICRIVSAVVFEGSLGAAQTGYGIAAGELWQHSAATALAAQAVARERGCDENLVFTAALLHDIGKLVLSASLEGAYTAIINETETSGRSLLEAEKAILGVEHAEVGGRVLARWDFPENLVRPVWHHHDPLQAQPHEQLAACVYVGDMIAHMIGYGYGHQAFAVRGRDDAMKMLAITPPDVESFALQTIEAFQQTSWFAPAEP